MYLCLAILILGSGGSGAYLIVASQNGGVGPMTGDGPTCLVAGICLVVVGLVFLGLWCLKKKAIDIGIACVQCATQCIFAMPSLLVQPALELTGKL